MTTILNINELYDLLSNKKHVVGKVMDIVPFVTTSTKRAKTLNNHLSALMGEYVRQICGYRYIDKKMSDDTDFYYSDNPIIEQIINKVYSNDDEKYNLNKFLSHYLFDNKSEIKPIHTYLYNYIPLTENKNINNDIKKYARFLRDILVNNSQELTRIFNNKDSDDILTELIINTLDELEEKKYENEYQCLLKPFSNLYKNDLIFLSKHKEYFIKTFPLLTQYYIFMYVIQLVKKFEQFENADYNKVIPLYFALDWESITQRRKAANDIDSYRYIKELLPNFFVHMHTMSQLSNNSINKSKIGSGNQIPFMNYSELVLIVKQHGQEVVDQFYLDVKNWINEYKKIFTHVKFNIEPKDLEDSFKVLFNCVKQGTNPQAAKNFGINIDDLGNGIFLKTRGSLGKVFNMNHDLLLLLTAVSVKDERVPLNSLFSEFEKRGVQFDRYSKKEIVKVFDSLNILEKKSDSGDAQYVKPLL